MYVTNDERDVVVKALVETAIYRIKFAMDNDEGDGFSHATAYSSTYWEDLSRATAEINLAKTMMEFDPTQMREEFSSKGEAHKATVIEFAKSRNKEQA